MDSHPHNDDRHLPGRRRRPPAAVRRHGLQAAVSTLLLLGSTLFAIPVAYAAGPSVTDLTALARRQEDAEDYRGAATTLKTLRGRVTPDPDLELWLALFEARAGDLDSAHVRLRGPLLDAAVADTGSASRWKVYPWGKETSWTDGRWGGWDWYVWRARTEVAAALGEWSEALAAARRTVAARPSNGRDWHACALCAAHLGRDDEARECLARAAELDPSLPEPHYLEGLLAWRAGRRAEAQESFRAAAALDTTDDHAALAMVHAGLPGSRPDSLPVELLSGPRRAALLTSPVGPKREAHRRLVSTPTLLHDETPPALAGSGGASGARPTRLMIAMLVDSDGRVVVSDVPDLRSADIDPARVAQVLATLPRWRFSPATNENGNVSAWTGHVVEFQP
jgi:tetratricopeptide (TPR) repeat protein